MPRAESSTPRQQEFLTDLLHHCNLGAAEEQAYYLKKTGRVILTPADISKNEASEMINELKTRRDRVWANYIPPPIGVENLVVTEIVETLPVEEELVYETTGPPPWD